MVTCPLNRAEIETSHELSSCALEWLEAAQCEEEVRFSIHWESDVVGGGAVRHREGKPLDAARLVSELTVPVAAVRNELEPGERLARIALDVKRLEGLPPWGSEGRAYSVTVPLWEVDSARHLRA